MTKVYICHAYSDAPKANCSAIRDLCRALSHEGLLPIAPQLYLPHFINEKTERDEAMAACLSLIDVCQIFAIYKQVSPVLMDPLVTRGMQAEIYYVRSRPEWKWPSTDYRYWDAVSAEVEPILLRNVPTGYSFDLAIKVDQ